MLTFFKVYIINLFSGILFMLLVYDYYFFNTIIIFQSRFYLVWQYSLIFQEIGLSFLFIKIFVFILTFILF